MEPPPFETILPTAILPYPTPLPIFPWFTSDFVSPNSWGLISSCAQTLTVSTHLLETHMDSFQYLLGSSFIFYYNMWLLQLFLVSCTHGCLPVARPEGARCFPHFFFSLLFTTFSQSIALLTSFYTWKRTRRDWKIYLSSKCGPPSSSLSVSWCGGSSASLGEAQLMPPIEKSDPLTCESVSPGPICLQILLLLPSKWLFLSNNFLLPTIFPEQVQMI